MHTIWKPWEKHKTFGENGQPNDAIFKCLSREKQKRKNKDN